MQGQVQRYNDMTFSSKSEALDWVLDKIPSSDRESIEVAPLSTNENIDTRHWGLIWKAENRMTTNEAEEIQNLETSNYIRMSDFSEASDKEAFQELIEFLMPRVEAAIRGEVSVKTVDEIYSAVKERKFSNKGKLPESDIRSPNY